MIDGMREKVKAAEQYAVGVLVGLFASADGLDPRPTMGAVPPHEESQNIVINVVASTTKQMKVLQMRIKRPAQEDTGRSSKSPSVIRSN